MKKLFLNKYVRYGLIAIGGFIIGWMFFQSPHKTDEKKLTRCMKIKLILDLCHASADTYI